MSVILQDILINARLALNILVQLRVYKLYHSYYLSTDNLGTDRGCLLIPACILKGVWIELTKEKQIRDQIQYLNYLLKVSMVLYGIKHDLAFVLVRS